MGTTKKAQYSQFNGTDDDVLHFETQADIVTIADTGNKITATNVEDALSEVADKINVLSASINTDNNNNINLKRKFRMGGMF